MKKNNRFIEYDILRVILVMLVLIGHCTFYTIQTKYGGINYINEVDFPNSQRILSLLTKFIYSFHMPLFFMLSGALFANAISKGKYNNIFALTKDKFKRLILPFIIITVVYAIPLKYISEYYINSQNFLKDTFIGQVLIEGNTHLWFLPTLFCIFFITYIIEKKKIDNKKVIAVFIVLNLIQNKIPINIIQYIFKNLIYFYIGYNFQFNRLKFVEYISKHKTIIVPVVVLMISFFLLDIKIEKCNFILRLLNCVVSICLAILGSLMIYILSYIISNYKIVNNKIIKRINEYSFGIYLYSDTLNYVILFLISKISRK